MRGGAGGELKGGFTELGTDLERNLAEDLERTFEKGIVRICVGALPRRVPHEGGGGFKAQARIPLGQFLSLSLCGKWICCFFFPLATE